MADNFTELKKNLSGATGNVSVDGTRMGYRFSNSTVIASEGFISIADAKSGKAKSELIRQTNNSIRTTQGQIEYYNEQITKEQAVINDPASNKIQVEGAKRRLAEAQVAKAREEKDLAGAQSVLAYANSGFQADLDSLTSKAEAEQKRIDDETKAKQNPAPTPEPATSGSGQPPPTTETAKAENKAPDDAGTPPANPGKGEPATTAPQPTSPSSQQTASTSTSESKGPGAAGNVKAQEKPGKRLKNPLGSFASYTYQLTLYMITPDAYDLFIQSGRKNINVLANATNDGGGRGTGTGAGAYIIAQSGGINNTTSQRAPGFETDFYIDNLKITTATNGKSSLSASNTTSMSFQIIEPYGFSFITKLRNAGQALQQYSNALGYQNLSNASKQFFVLGVRFQGYDINGNTLTGAETLYGNPLDPEGTENGIFEQFYDIILTKITFKLDGKAVVYNITAAATAPQTAFGLKRGILKSPKELEGNTVYDVLAGPSGLFAALTKEQEESVKKKEIKIPNTYSVEFIGDAKERIGYATMVTAADTQKYSWPGSAAKTTQESNDAEGAKSTPNPTKRIIKFSTGGTIIQYVSQVIGQSSYLLDALKAVYKANQEPDPKTGSPAEIKKDQPATVSWFNISCELSNPKWDDVALDWAYNMKYLIQTYETPIITSSYSNPGMQYYGPHKRYEYWFSGQNSEVLEYSANFDNTYFNVALNTDPSGNAAPGGSSQSGQVSTTPGFAQGDSSGKTGIGMQAQNSYITSLYDPGTYAAAKIKIFGDPDFLVQESATSINDLYSRFYGVNGYTVNPNGGQVFVEIDFKEAVDYKNSTGIMSINDSILFWQYPPEIASLIKGVSYMVQTVTSSFSGGKFIQDLDLIINTFPGTGVADRATTGEEAGREGSKPTSGPTPGDPSSTPGQTGLKPDPAPPKGTTVPPGQTPAGSSSAVTPPSSDSEGYSAPSTPTQGGGRETPAPAPATRPPGG
jgi:hypothetical protein